MLYERAEKWKVNEIIELSSEEDLNENLLLQWNKVRVIAYQTHEMIIVITYNFISTQWISVLFGK